MNSLLDEAPEQAQDGLVIAPDYLSINNSARIPAEPDSLQMLELSLIRPSANNPRSVFDVDELADLSSSIAQHGVLQPITVRLMVSTEENDFGPRYEIIAGERRFRASQLVGLTHIPAIVREVDSDAEALELALVENLDRADISDMEKAAGFHSLTQFGWHQVKIAARFRLSQPAIANTLRLLKLPEPVQKMIREKKLSGSHGRALLPTLGFAAVPPPGEHSSGFNSLAEQYAQSAVDEGWSVNALETEVKKRFKPTAEPTLLDVEPAASGATNFVAPEPAPLSAQGDMTDAEWEASAKPQEENDDESADEEAGQERQTNGVAAHVPAEHAGATGDDEIPPAPDTDAEQEQGDEKAAKPVAADNASDAERAVADPVAGDASGAAAGSAEEAQAGKSPSASASNGAPPVAAKAAAAKAETPAVPVAPPGWMFAMINEGDYNKANEAGLWPLGKTLLRITELERQMEQVKAAAPLAENTSPENTSPALALTIGAASQLAEMNRTGEGIFSDAQSQVLDELFPERESTDADHIIAMLTVRWLRTVQSHSAEIQKGQQI